jgi:formylglycine-generating enzyme required for sulfatase activity
MKIVSKLLPALMAAVLVVSFADGASATKRLPEGVQAPVPVAEEGQTSPPRAPRQFFPEKRIQPLTPEIEQSLIPKDSFKECDVCPEMVVVPKGSFMMGTPITEVDRAKGEDPLHRVSFAKPFAVGRFTISFDDWDACLADGGCSGIKGDDKGFGRGRMPAQGINFEAAKSYLAWLSKKVGRTYRLPSESEREYFTRAGTTMPFWFGNTISSQDANYLASTPYANGPRGVDSKGPVVVDSYAPNPFGLYQVHGNVWEWTEDCFNKRYNEDTPTDGAPWLEGDCGKRILRGGTWNWSADVARSGARDDSYAGGSKSFRVVRTLNVRL